MKTTHVALLRGINVGGKNRITMVDLASVFADAGALDVRTYIQSGNVLFVAEPSAATEIARRVGEWLLSERALRTPVVLRSATEIAVVARGNPFLARGADEGQTHVMFLADLPSRAALASLDPGRSPPDELAVVGRDVFLLCPHGVAKTKLTNAYFDGKLGTTSTCRNWRTVLTLHAMAGAPAAARASGR